MRSFILAAILLASTTAHAENVFLIDGKVTTQTEAILALLRDANANVLKCQPQELKQNKTSLSTKNKSK